MKITALQPQKRSNRRISVFLDGAFLFGLASDTVRALGLRVGMEVDRAELDRFAREEQLHQARNYAFRLLSYKARTESELRQRLVRKGFAPDIVTATIERLRELGLVNDADFARRFAEDRVSIGHRGRHRIRAELRRRGVERSEIEAAVAQAPDEAAAALAVAQKYRERNRGLEPPVLRRRLWGFLARRGFGPDIITRALGASEAGVTESTTED
jgi:regulatory protein